MLRTILMLTARAEGDRVQGLVHLPRHLTKPFSAKELIARVNALLRRAYSAGYRDVRRNNSVIWLLPTPCLSERRVVGSARQRI